MWAANTFKGDITHNLWYDYSNTSAITGWGSFFRKVIQVNYREGAVQVIFDLYGISNSTTTNFTIPVNTCVENRQILNGSLFYPATAVNNNTMTYGNLQIYVTTQSGLAVGTTNTNGNSIIITGRFGVSGGISGTWTASGVKLLAGCFILPTN